MKTQSVTPQGGALISSTHRGSRACPAEEVRAPVIAPGARGVEEGTQQVVDQYPEGGRGLVASAVAAVEDSCCSLEVDTSVASWVVGRW